MNAFITYLKNVRGELAHMSWPTRQQAIGYTLLFIGTALVVAAYLGFFDYVFTTVVEEFLI